MNKRIGTAWLINIFALLHVISILLCRAAAVSSSYYLTILSIALVAIICVRKKLPVNFTVIFIVLANIFGVFLGRYIGSTAFSLFGRNSYNTLISTFLTTEIIGWGTVFIGSSVPESNDTDRISEKHIIFPAAIAFGVLVLRMIFDNVTENYVFVEHSMAEVISSFLASPLILLMLACLTIAFASYMQKAGRKPGTLRLISLHALFFIVICPATALVTYYNITPQNTWSIEKGSFLEILVVTILVETVIYSFVFMAFYVISERRKLNEQKILANLANGRYMSLKQQVNPHFLFNNLNILDCLVAENKNDEARDFIGHLTGLYRYMLKYENEQLVTLEEEISYVKMYMDLLHVRFPEGLNLEMNLSQDDLKRYVVPYSVQMLVENAVKHNTTSRTSPLTVRIESTGESICVSNNRIPRISPLESTGHGLEYVKQSYFDKSGQHISITEDENEFKVTIPLLQ